MSTLRAKLCARQPLLVGHWSALGQIAAAILFAGAVLYGVAFEHAPLAHNAAHDVRHIAAVPCH